MIRTIVVGIIGGVLFGVMDGVINVNPVAQRLMAVYQPIGRTSFNAAAGIAIDLVYGLVMAGVFVLFYPSLPGETGLVKGLSFGLLAWFFRVVMAAASQWMMFNIPSATLLYILGTGLAEMLILGVLYGLALRAVSLTPQ